MSAHACFASIHRDLAAEQLREGHLLTWGMSQVAQVVHDLSAHVLQPAHHSVNDDTMLCLTISLSTHSCTWLRPSCRVRAALHSFVWHGGIPLLASMLGSDLRPMSQERLHTSMSQPMTCHEAWFVADGVLQPLVPDSSPAGLLCTSLMCSYNDGSLNTSQCQAAGYFGTQAGLHQHLLRILRLEVSRHQDRFRVWPGA